MKCEIKITVTAKQDLREIALYIYEQSKDKTVATRFVKELQEKCDMLRSFPECGSIPDDRALMSNGYRFLVHKNYLIFYLFRKEENTAYIMAVFNAKRDYMRVMKKFL